MNGKSAWNFAQHFYARPGTSRLLLRLQDDENLDIPLVLILLHAAASGRSLEHTLVEDLWRQAGEWQRKVVTPLRQARRALDHIDHDLYEQAKALELSVEEAIIFRLGDSSSPADEASPEVAAFVNLDSYRRLAGLSNDAFDAVLNAFATYRGDQVP